jgi:CheY-like chemotaxis protein
MKSILVVDDSHEVLTQVEQLLRSAGYTVYATPFGRVALEYLRQHPVDLVLTDIYMPDVDGFDLMRAIRSRHPGMPVIAMSADPAEFGVLPAAVVLGSVGTLQKPFAGAALLSLVQDVLARSA